MEHIHPFVRQKISPFVMGEVLDVGGGWGRWKRDIAPYATHYLIADPFAAGADFKDDAAHLSSLDGTFDTVVSFEVLEHLEEPALAIAEMYRVLKPGGYLVITAPFLYPYHKNPIDFTRFSPGLLEHLATKVGFAIVEKGSIGNLITIAGVFAKTILKTTACFICRKMAYLTHRGLLLLARRYPAYPGANVRFFTHSYLIARKP